MNRLSFPVAAVLGASSLLLVDSAIKGAAILLLAVFVTLILRRDSAATRHLAWLVAIIGVLVVPVFSAVLPQWRVLPAWAVISTEPVAGESPVSAVEMTEQPQQELPVNTIPVTDESPAIAGGQPGADVPVPHSVTVIAEVNPDPIEPASPRWNIVNALPLLWSIGFSVLILRLMAARLLLWSNERRGTVIALSRHANGQARFGFIRSRIRKNSGDAGCESRILENPATRTDDSIVAAFEAATRQLGVRQRISLLIHSERTIPVVWGIFRFRLLLPVAARQWRSEQLRSVLLHELAHVQRRDTIAQLLAQFACALYWFNPLVWFAAWRLHVERERACDDLVLASGVTASAYAEHLLNVSTRLSSSPWTQACGLAMARCSSLEGRLAAVLSKKRNRRSVTSALIATALVLGAAVAVPIAMLHAADEKPAEDTRPAAAVESPSNTDEPTGGTKLTAGLEKQLKWGEPVNGLRAAISLRRAPGEPQPQPDEDQELYLVVQNVSDGPVRLNDRQAPAHRRLYIKRFGKIVQALRANEPALGVVLLQPREVTFQPVFATDVDFSNGRTLGALMAEGLLKDKPRTVYVELEISQTLAGTWTGKLVTGEAGGADLSPKDKQPEHADAQALFRIWQANARTDGKIPGALIGQLGEWVKYFIELNEGEGEGGKLTVKFKQLLPRFAAKRDWTQADAIVLLDDVVAIHRIPFNNALDAAAERVILTGEPLPAELTEVPWGKPAADGLRAAWLLEPRKKEYPLGTSLKSRILVHNSGKQTVFFIMPSWQQTSAHAAHDAKDTAIKVTSTSWTTMGRMSVYRLAPGAYCETPTPGIGVGARTGVEDWANVRVGSWILAKAGDDVRLTPGAVEVRFSPFVVGIRKLNGLQKPKDAADLWNKFVAERVARELPIPTGAADREQLLRRVVRDLYGVEPNKGEIAAFVNDRSPASQHTLFAGQMVETRAKHNRSISPFTGTLPPGEITFRVLATDLDAAKKPRVVTGPGYYNLGNKTRLQVERTRKGDRRTNKATIRFYSSKPKAEPHGIALPDGHLTWAIAWEPGSTVLWATQKGLVRKIDFAEPAQVQETRLEAPYRDKMPKAVFDALNAALSGPGAPVPKRETLRPRKSAAVIRPPVGGTAGPGTG